MNIKLKVSITILVLLILLIATNCGAAPPTPEGAERLLEYPRQTDGWSRFVDDEAGVVCWWYKSGYGGGLSCLPLSETNLER